MSKLYDYNKAPLSETMVFIPGGVFTMGSGQEKIDICVDFWSNKLVEENFNRTDFRNWILKEYPPHKKDVKAFMMSKYPVTNGQYKHFIYEAEYDIPESISLGEPDNHPVWGVILKDIDRFIDWANQKKQLKYRLPSETEWEYVAKGGKNNDYPFGNTFDSKKCNTIESAIGHTTPVDYYPYKDSPFGICDLGGNVEEWTSSIYKPYPGGSLIEDDLFVALGNGYPVIRGGSFIRGGDLARTARRHGPFPSDKYKFIGFRLAADPA